MVTRSTARASTILLLSLLGSFAALEACSGSDALFTEGDGGADDGATAQDGTIAEAGGGDGAADGAGDATLHDGGGDAHADATGSDATSDANGDADAEGDAADLDASDASDAMLEMDAALTVEKVSPAACPWGLSVASGTVYWTESPILGCSPNVRACPTSGCATLPAAIYAGSSGQSLPVGISATNNDEVFYGDNQVPNNYLWKMSGDGGARVAWGTVSGNAAATATDGTSIYWGLQSGLYRAPVASGTVPPASTHVLSGDLAGSTNGAPETITVDANRVYAVLGGNVVESCPLGSDCVEADASTPTTLVSETGVRGLASDGTNLFVTSGMSTFTASGHERLLRVLADGSGAAEALADTTPAADGQGSHLGVAVDATNVYWGTMEGVIYSCAKDAIAPCTPIPRVTGVEPYALRIDGGYLYWGDRSGAVYRALLP